VWLWNRIRGVGGSRDAQADEREEFGGEDAGEAEAQYLEGAGPGAGGLASQDAADVAEADLQEFKPPRDPAP
jgi:hypothetical protein